MASAIAAATAMASQPIHVRRGAGAASGPRGSSGAAGSGVVGGARDLVQRDAVQEAVGDPVRVVAGDERLQRRDLADEVRDRDAAPLRLRAAGAERDPRRGLRVAADDEHRVHAVERAGDAAPLVLPGALERGVHWCGHGAPSYTQKS